jgi:hypothetical protein
VDLRSVFLNEYDNNTSSPTSPGSTVAAKPPAQQMNNNTAPATAPVKKEEKKSSSMFACFANLFKASEPAPEDRDVYSIGLCGTPKHHDQHPGSHYYYMTHRKHSF